MSPLIKNVLIALVVALTLGFGYTYLTGEDETALTSEGTLESEAYRETQKFLGYLREIERIELGGAIFTSIQFTSLIDLRQEIEDEPTGRQNPFEPVR